MGDLIGGYGFAILSGFCFGLLNRFMTLQADYRQYPSYPHGYITHLTFGGIAAALGAVAIPALLEKEFTAVTFIALAAQQFRDIRSIERENLGKLEETELVPRGSAYIEGIAKVFEVRNYLAFLVAILVSGVTVALNVSWGIFFGLVLALGVGKFRKGPRIREIAQVFIADFNFDGPLLKVEDITIMNIAQKEVREQIKKLGLAAVIAPRDDNARATLANLGQRQAIVHDVANSLGVRIDLGEPDFSPIIKRSLETGRVVLFIVPMEKNENALLEAIRRVPVIESAQRKPLNMRAGRIAAD